MQQQLNDTENEVAMLAHIHPSIEQGIKEGQISPMYEKQDDDEKSFSMSELEESKISNTIASMDKADVTVGDAQRIKSVTIDKDAITN